MFAYQENEIKFNKDSIALVKNKGPTVPGVKPGQRKLNEYL